MKSWRRGSLGRGVCFKEMFLMNLTTKEYIYIYILEAVGRLRGAPPIAPTYERDAPLSTGEGGPQRGSPCGLPQAFFHLLARQRARALTPRAFSRMFRTLKLSTCIRTHCLNNGDLWGVTIMDVNKIENWRTKGDCQIHVFREGNQLADFFTYYIFDFADSI